MAKSDRLRQEECRRRRGIEGNELSIEAVMTQQEVAQALGIPRQRVSEAERSGLRKFKARMKGWL